MSAIDTSFATQLGNLDLEDPDYEGNAVAVYQNYVTAKIAAGEMAEAAPEIAIGPHFVRDGVRTFAKLASFLGKFYMKHKSTIDPFLDLALTTAMTTIGSRAAEIANMNNRGPT